MTEMRTSVLKSLKRGSLRWASRSGFSSVVLNSSWRRGRLLIICYHGVSLEDEHEWKPSLYVTADQLRARLELLRQMDCAVLSLDDALQRLYEGELPPRSVCLTFDDGTYDFYRKARPVLTEYGFPATLYLTTYYSNFNRPVFNGMCSYLLWKGQGRVLDWPEILGGRIKLDEVGRRFCEDGIRAFAARKDLSGKEKDELLVALADKLDLDYQELCEKRIIHLISRAEAKELAQDGVDIQLHTHRHRAPLQRDQFLREIDDNRHAIRAFSGSEPRHFCYPSGFHVPQFRAWLKERGITSATTCEAGLASGDTNPLALPRLIDNTTLSEAEFAGWVSGVASFLPRRPMSSGNGKVLEPVAAGVL